MPEPVTSKRKFVRLYQRGAFGNRAPTWNGLDDYLSDDYHGLVHIRNRVAGGATYYNVSPGVVPYLWRKVTNSNSDSWYLSAMAPTEDTLIQGEVQRSPRVLDLRYTTVRQPMRNALANEQYHAYGLQAVCLLRYYLDPASYDWLQELLDLYPDHVVEFSTYECCWGTEPCRNTVVWEVRRY